MTPYILILIAGLAFLFYQIMESERHLRRLRKDEERMRAFLKTTYSENGSLRSEHEKEP